MTKNLNDTLFSEIIPASIAGDETIMAAAQALDSEIQYINEKILNIFIWSRIDTIEEPLLSALAHQMHVDFWDDSFSLEIKQGLIKDSIAWHRIKGTPVAVEKMIKLIIGGGTVEDWDEYGGNPFYFQIRTTHSLGNYEILEKQLIPAINRAKNTRSWLEKIIVERKTAGTLNLNFVSIQKKLTIIGPSFWIKPIEYRTIGVAPRIGTRLTINADI